MRAQPWVPSVDDAARANSGFGEEELDRSISLRPIVIAIWRILG
jgi:hypothetical protein